MVTIRLIDIGTVTIDKGTINRDTINKPINSMGIVYYHWGYMGMGYKIIFYKDVPCLYSHTHSNHLRNNRNAHGV